MVEVRESSPCGGTSSLLVMAHHPIGCRSPETRLHQKSWLLSCSKPSYRNKALYPGCRGHYVTSDANALTYMDVLCCRASIYRTRKTNTTQSQLQKKMLCFSFLLKLKLGWTLPCDWKGTRRPGVLSEGGTNTCPMMLSLTWERLGFGALCGITKG